MLTKIRKAVPDDALMIAVAHKVSWQSAYRDILLPERLASMDAIRTAEHLRNDINKKTEVIYIAETDNRIAGFFSAGLSRVKNGNIENTKDAELYALYIHPDFWRKKIGTLLLGKAESLLKSKKFDRMVLWVFEANTLGRTFYESRGFCASGNRKTIYFGNRVKCMEYIKYL